MSRICRRTFLAAGAALPLAAQPDAPSLPTIQLGKHRVTRLIAGANPVNGFGHSTRRMDELMRDWFTVERTTEFLLNCWRNGINTWQSSYSPKVRDALTAARSRGANLHFICLTSGKDAAFFNDVLALKPIAIVHHGGVTDTLFKTGHAEQVRDFVKKVKDLGILAGVSTHDPSHMARVEDSNWENDLYMGCFYNLGRTQEEVRQMVGDNVLGELYPASDPLKMTARIREVKKPVLGFKILAAGRLCNSEAQIEKAFAFAYKNIKSTDAAIVGMFPVFSDEVKVDTGLARKYAG